MRLVLNIKLVVLTLLIVLGLSSAVAVEASETSAPNKRGFEVTSEKVEIYPNEYTEVATIKLHKRDIDRYLNKVNVEFKATKKGKKAQPWETFSSVEYIYNGKVVHVEDIGQKADWKKGKEKGKSAWSLNAFKGNVKVAAKTAPEIEVKLRTKDQAPVGERWIVKAERDGIVIWTAKDGHKSYSLPKNIVTIETK